MNASQSSPPELPALEYDLLRALDSAAGARGVAELEAMIARRPGSIEATVRRLASNGFARQRRAWLLSRTGRAALADPASWERFTVPQQRVLGALDEADGARTVEELASTIGDDQVVAAIGWLAAHRYVRPVPAFEATDRIHHLLSGVITPPPTQRKTGRRRGKPSPTA
ncbi:hypothetical protein BJY24_005744 [Nocardia transvalensis]|uniref:Uncharacterized protein n=1 Tax=Nocardia transvalensis TaxID=37333 RepID=A0A7W9UKZ5_9NOCA|nr:hypothetical protein [Nocardia transvalensis]MBB5916832.1 hypothetical protein [Nocardia transvalensis]